MSARGPHDPKPNWKNGNVAESHPWFPWWCSFCKLWYSTESAPCCKANMELRAIR